MKHPMFDEARALRSRLRLVKAGDEAPTAPRALTLWDERKPNWAMIAVLLGGVAVWVGFALWIWH